MPDNILLLQGPVGPFFSRLAQDLAAHGHRVYKINFNAGDRFFYRRAGAVDYRGGVDGWRPYLDEMIGRLAIDRIYVFGDCRIYHEIAREVAATHGVRYFVFEEGYLRPDFITLEEGGVNGHSSLRFPDGAGIVNIRPEVRPRFHFRHAFLLSGWYAILYYIVAVWGAHRYPFYRHHRPLNVLGEGSRWLVSGWRRMVNWRNSRLFERWVQGGLSHRYFLVPLQVHCDMQVVRHSRFDSVEDFIATVIESFSVSADHRFSLVFKHHPLDRGYRDYTALIDRLARQYGVAGRVHYVFDSHLPTLLRHALGTVTINSTVGLSSLHHGTPVKVMGEAVYDRAGLTFDGPLELFWQRPGKVDLALYRKFRQYLLDTNQANGNFYQRGAKAANASGVAWPAALVQQHFSRQQPPGHRHSIRPRLVKAATQRMASNME